MEGTEGVCWLGQPQAGGSEEERRRGELKIKLFRPY